MTTESSADISPLEVANSSPPNIDAILKQLEYERTSLVLDRACLFCKQRFRGNRKFLLNHLIQFHHFRVGHPDNIVFVEELLRILDAELAALRCIFCEGEFPDWATMKEHMRKKGHKEIPMHCGKYDRFYVINYVANRRSMGEEATCEQETHEEFEDWREVTSFAVQCLFCVFEADECDIIEKHMQDEHHFRLSSVITGGQVSLTCYDRIRIVNYIRSMTNQQRCYICQSTVESNGQLVEHLRLHDDDLDLERSRSRWSDDIYLTPVIEGDALLCHVLSITDDDSDADGTDVIAEELSQPDEPDPAILQLINQDSDTSPSPPPS